MIVLRKLFQYQTSSDKNLKLGEDIYIYMKYVYIYIYIWKFMKGIPEFLSHDFPPVGKLRRGAVPATNNSMVKAKSKMPEISISFDLDMAMGQNL